MPIKKDVKKLIYEIITILIEKNMRLFERNVRSFDGKRYEFSLMLI